MAKLQDFVDAAIKKGGFPKNHIALRKMIQTICGTRGRSILGTQEIIDDVLEELEHFGHVPKQPNRKTTRYYPHPIRTKSDREEYVLSLARNFIKTDGRRNARGKVEKTKGSWAHQESRARDFLEDQENSRILRFKVTLKEFFSAIRSLNAQKAVTTRLVSKRVSRKTSSPNQPNLL